MSRIMILGAAGSLGKHVLAQAVAANHDVTVVVRTPSKLPPEFRSSVKIHQADIVALSASQLAALVRNQDALINAAGYVGEGQPFVALVDHIVTSIETLPISERPICWFLAGAALLDIGSSGRRGVDLPVIKKTYWPHAENFKRLQASSLDWRLLCPGPMVEVQPIGISRLRVSHERLPVAMPAEANWLPEIFLVPVFTQCIPEMILPYADAAALMLTNLQPNGAMSHQRIGLALPPGMHGKKERWSARSSTGD